MEIPVVALYDLDLSEALVPIEGMTTERQK
jgi:hypothetical protein